MIASYLASKYHNEVDVCVTNAGPNSGHTCYHEGEKIILKQLPTFAIIAAKMDRIIPIYIAPGAIVNVDVLNKEASQYPGEIFLHRKAAVVRADDVDAERETASSMSAIASTQQGVGMALSRKINRHEDAVVESIHHDIWAPNIQLTNWAPRWDSMSAFYEVSQGFSLGINSQFYPNVTSRECTVMQALADARIHPDHLVRSYMSIRTYPIRVGNLGENSSGAFYDDQEETSWDKIGVEPEMTTVTGRVRRVFTFSQRQYGEALIANRPRYVLVNFMNYLKAPSERVEFVRKLRETHSRVGITPTLWYGYGPRAEDIKEKLQ